MPAKKKAATTDKARQNAYKRILAGGRSTKYPGLTASGLMVGKNGKIVQRKRAQRSVGAGFLPRGGYCGRGPVAGAVAGEVAAALLPLVIQKLERGVGDLGRRQGVIQPYVGTRAAQLYAQKKGRGLALPGY